MNTTTKILAYLKKHYLPIILVIGGIIDQTTDLLVQLLSEVNAPAYYGTILRIIVITVGAIKLYLTSNNKSKK